MATIINNPDTGNSNSSSLGLIVGIVLAAVVVFLLLMYGIPALREKNSGTTVNIPDKINIDVNKSSNY